jgi:integrase
MGASITLLMASIRKRKWRNKEGEISIRYLVDFYDADGKRGKKLFDTRKEADDYRIEIESQLRKGTYRPEADKITVSELGERFLTHCEERMERRERMTRRNFITYQGYVKNYIAPDPDWHAKKHAKPGHEFHVFEKGIGNRTLAQLTVGTVTKFRDDLRAFGVSVPTTRKIIGMLQVMLAYGISLDLIAFNAARDVEVLASRADECKQITPPSPEIMRELIGLADERFRVILLFAAATGVRAGELHALRWQHIHFEQREVRVQTRVDAYRDEDVPKTKAGIRTIPLGEGVIRALRGWRQITAYSKAGDLVFPNYMGTHWSHDGMIKSKWLPLFKRLAARWQEQRRNDFPEQFNWHALRHFAISCWIDAGLPPKTVQTFAGHSSLQVTMDRYGHLFRSDSHGRAMDAIAEVIDAPATAQPAKNAHRKWSDFAPK